MGCHRCSTCPTGEAMNSPLSNEPVVKRNWFFYHDSLECPMHGQQDYVSCAICDPEELRKP